MSQDQDLSHNLIFKKKDICDSNLSMLSPVYLLIESDFNILLDNNSLIKRSAKWLFSTSFLSIINIVAQYAYFFSSHVDSDINKEDWPDDSFVSLNIWIFVICFSLSLILFVVHYFVPTQHKTLVKKIKDFYRKQDE